MFHSRLNRMLGTEHPCLIADLMGKAVNFSSLFALRSILSVSMSLRVLPQENKLNFDGNLNWLYSYFIVSIINHINCLCLLSHLCT